jgi:acetoin utilization deacetylase AcuC-like enzyme
VPPGSGIGAYGAAFERVVLPALRAFDPELVLVSSGFDASALDPLSHTMLNSTAFGNIARQLVDFAAQSATCRGRIVFTHEGGYSDIHAPFCGLRVVEALRGTFCGFKVNRW